MKQSKKPFSLLTKKNLAATSALALAGLASAPGAVALNSTSEVELGPVSKGNANVTICHKGRDMQVSFPGMIGHLVHGDSIGSCDEPDGGGGRGGL